MAASDSYAKLKEIFGDSRDARHPNLELACEVFGELPYSDLLTWLTLETNQRSEAVSIPTAIRGNRFNEPSSVSQRDFHWLEGIIHQSVGEDIDFVELSPLQPFGINKALAGINQKNVVSTLKRSEVNADITTALLRVALARYTQNSLSEPVRLASNTRVTRGQVFEEGSKFLPHFKIFGQVSIGAHEKGNNTGELETIVSHLASEVDVLGAIKATGRSRIDNLEVRIASTAFLRGLIHDGKVDSEDLRRHTYSEGYSYITVNQLDIPETLQFSSGIGDSLQELGLKQEVRLMQRFADILERRRPDIFDRAQLYLGRTAGIGYYKHICYDLAATNDTGVTVPVADGGSTVWAASATRNKSMYTVASAIGTELVLQHLVRK